MGARWRRICAPLLLAGGEPPAYWLAAERSWSAEIDVVAGSEQTLVFDWDGADSFVPRLAAGD